MWKIEHPGGQREINALHVPIDTPVELIMTSEDVIHDFFVPAFRVKRDVLPGRYETLWFRADRVGTYHLFCAQFCGTDHSNMIGDVVVMAAPDYADWLTANGAGDTLADAEARHCSSAMAAPDAIWAAEPCARPSLAGLYGSPVPLVGRHARSIADDRYIREFDHVSEATDRGELRTGDAVLRQRDRRGRSRAARRLHQVLWPRRGTDESRSSCRRSPDQLSVRRRLAEKWLLTTDHKRIAILYMISITVFFFLGGAAAALIRYNLIVPEGMIVEPRPTTACSPCMASSWCGSSWCPPSRSRIGNFVVPLMLGARDLAFPRLNLVSWYLFMAGGFCALYALFSGGVDTGWTFYTPLSSNYATGPRRRWS